METYRSRARVLKVTDGDTLEVNVDLGFGVFTIVDVRLRNVWAPEISTESGKIITNKVIEMCVDKELWIETRKGLFGDTGQRSFARWIGDVYFDGEHLNPIIQDLVNFYKDK